MKHKRSLLNRRPRGLQHRAGKLFTVAILVTLGGASARAQDGFAQLTVSAQMDVWRAGGYNDGSDGLAPASYSFAAGSGKYITFPSIQGTWNCGVGPLFGPDGSSSKANCNGPYDIFNPQGTFSGYASTDFYGGLVGMFLEDTLPDLAPSPFRFYVTNDSRGGIPTAFRVLSPEIGQVFFIGDGLTGTGSGERQVFRIPPTATNLYFGYVDGATGGDPNFYTGNQGSLQVVLQEH